MAAKGPKKKAKAKPSPEQPIEKNGWTLYAHPALLDQIDKLASKSVEENDPQGDATKTLAWLTRAIFDEIPSDPTLDVYRLGRKVLGGITHWFRDKYAQRFRLFFRYDSRAKIIAYGWVNDENSLRTRGSKNDAYEVFKRQLANGCPPDSWADLLREASAASAVRRLKGRKPKTTSQRRR